MFKSRLFNSLRSYANLYFTIFIAILVLLFVDAIRDVHRFSRSHEEIDVQTNPQAEVQIHMKLFRAQRNFYIAGFSLFLWFVLRRMVTLLSKQATLQASSEAALKQAQSATDAAKKLMEEKDNKTNENKDVKPKVSTSVTSVVDAAVMSNEKQKELDKTLVELEKTRQELHKSNLDLEAMRKQAEATNKEYDRLLEEHSKLQDKCKSEGASKKED